jgi:hypothetical protein
MRSVLNAFRVLDGQYTTQVVTKEAIMLEDEVNLSDEGNDMSSPMIFAPNRICVRDPIANVLLRISRGKGSRAFAMALTIYGIFCIGGGWLLSSYYAHGQSQPLLKIYDPQELPFALFVYLVACPAAWTFSVNELVGISRMFSQLYANEVIGRSKVKHRTLETFLTGAEGVYNHIGYLAAIVAVVGVVLVIWVAQIENPVNQFRFGSNEFWFHINRIYFWLVWLPLMFLPLYMVLWIIVRRFITARMVKWLMESFEIIPQLYHPDRCSGMSPIGNYAVSFSPVLLVAGSWLALVISYPLFFGEQANLKLDTFIYLALYALSVPSSVIIPVWGTHSVLKKAKYYHLDAIGKRIRTLLSLTAEFPGTKARRVAEQEFSLGNQAALLISLSNAERQFEMIEKEHNTWPFNVSAISRYGISTLTPLLSASLSLVLRLLGKQ